MKNIIKSISNFMTSIYGANWRTSFMGDISALYIVCKPWISPPHVFNLQTDYPKIIQAICVFIFGRIMSDAKITNKNAAAISVVAPAPPVNQQLLDLQAGLKMAQGANNTTMIAILQSAIDQIQKTA